MMVERNRHSVLETRLNDCFFQGTDYLACIDLIALRDLFFFSLAASDIWFDIPHLLNVLGDISSYLILLQFLHFSSLPACISILLALLIIG